MKGLFEQGFQVGLALESALVRHLVYGNPCGSKQSLDGLEFLVSNRLADRHVVVFVKT